MTKLAFYVGGTPLPKGSGTVHKGVWFETADRKTKRRPAGALKRWSSTVGWAAKTAASEAGITDLLNEPLTVALVFYVDADPSVQGSGDIDKLTRAILDALEGVIYKNDARVVELFVEKHREIEGDPGVWIQVRPYEGSA